MERAGLLIADAGGTKTEWKYIHPSTGYSISVTTGPINATTGSVDSIKESLISLKEAFKKEISFHPSLKVFFHGAGCHTKESRQKFTDIFAQIFNDFEYRLMLFTDLEGAGLALFGDSMGVGCILGTGSASFLWKNGLITDNVPSLGYILGDEGSGAFMGKMLINRYYKRELPPYLMRNLESFKEMAMSEILLNVYNSPHAGKFLSSFVPFLKDNENEKFLSEIIENSLKLFFEKNVLKYNYRSGDKIRFVGGVADIFSDRLKKLSSSYCLEADVFLKNPIDSLTQYYIDHEI